MIGINFVKAGNEVISDKPSRFIYMVPRNEFIVHVKYGSGTCEQRIYG